MKEINLKEYYPYIYQNDIYVKIPEQISDLLTQFNRQVHAVHEKRRRYKAYYSLDLNDGIHLCIFSQVQSAEDTYIQKVENEALYKAILSLSKKQMKRIYAHYFLGLSFTKMARIERVNESSVRRSIEQALQNLKKNIK